MSAKGLGSAVWIIIGGVLLAILVGVYFFFKGSSGGKQKKQPAISSFSSGSKGNASKQESSSGNEKPLQKSAGVASYSGSSRSSSLTAEQEAKLDKYVKYYLDKGIAPAYISQYLVGKGWNADAVSISLRKFPSSGSSQGSATQTPLSREAKLDRYVKFYLDKNIAPEYIVQYLVGKGWTADEVNASLRKFGK